VVALAAASPAAPPAERRERASGGEVLTLTTSDGAYVAVQDALVAAPVQRHPIEPAAVGAARLGNFGLFRPQAQALWPRLLALAIDEPEPLR
jgi:hypothetical protein